MFGQGLGDVVDRQIRLFQAVGIQPEAEGQVVSSENEDPANAWNREQGIAHGLIDPAAQIGRVVEPLVMAETEDHQQVVGGAADLQPLARDRLGQASGRQIHFVLNLDRIQFRVSLAEPQAHAGATLTAA